MYLLRRWTHLSACVIMDSIGVIHHYTDIAGLEMN
jgi:hypothetical protein